MLSLLLFFVGFAASLLAFGFFSLGYHIPPALRWVAFASCFCFGALMVLVDYTIRQVRKLEKEKKKYTSLQISIKSFISWNNLQEAVDSVLQRQAVCCEDASQRVIAIQKGGLNAIGIKHTNDLEGIYKDAQDKFRSEQSEFYRLYNFASQFNQLAWPMVIVLKGRNFKDYLPQNPPVEEKAS